MELGRLIQSLAGQSCPPPLGNVNSEGQLPFSATLEGGGNIDRQTFLQTIRQYLAAHTEASAGSPPSMALGADSESLTEPAIAFVDLVASDPALAAMVTVLQHDAAALLTEKGNEIFADDRSNALPSDGNGNGSAFLSRMDADALLVMMNDRLAEGLTMSPERMPAPGSASDQTLAGQPFPKVAVTDDSSVDPRVQLVDALEETAVALESAEETAPVLQPQTLTPGSQKLSPELQTIAPELQTVAPESQAVAPELQTVPPDSQKATTLHFANSGGEDFVVDIDPSVDPLATPTDEKMTSSEKMTEKPSRTATPMALSEEDDATPQTDRLSPENRLKRAADSHAQPASSALSEAWDKNAADMDIDAGGDTDASGVAKKHPSIPSPAQNSIDSPGAAVEKELPVFEASKSAPPSVEATAQNKAQTTPSANTSAPAAAQVDFQKSVMDQIVEKAMIRTEAERSEVRIQLKPEVLGDVRMSIASENGQLSVKMITDQLATKEILEAQLHHLKAELDKQGLIVEKIEVAVNTNADPNQSREQFFQMSRDPYAGGGRREYGGNRQQRQQQSPPGNDAHPQTATRGGVNYFA